MKKLLYIITNLLVKHERKLRFLLVGGLLFLIDFGFSLFAYHLLNLSAGWASALGFSISFIVGFTLNKKVVFKRGKNNRFNAKYQLVLYCSLAVVNLFISAFAVEAMVGSGVIIEISKPIVVATIAIWNYIILNKIIFAIKK